MTENWNNALNKSSGDYVLMIGDDDYLLPGFFEKMEFFEHQPLMLFIATGMVGLIIGSFLNVVASRVPIMLGRIWRKEYADIKNQKLLFPQSAKDDPFNLWRPGSCCGLS